MNNRLRNFRRHPAAWLLPLLVLAGCASETKIALLPDNDGHVGSVEVIGRTGAQTLTQPQTVTSLSNDGGAPTPPVPLSDPDLRKIWGAALAALPPVPLTYNLYFQTGTADLTPESVAELPGILAKLTGWPYARLVIAGHADAVGSDDVNLRLSRDRAATVRDRFVESGVATSVIDLSSHGKRNPLVPTPDGVPEPRNRRVSVTIQ